MIDILDQELSEECPNLEEDMLMVPINKLGQYIESDNLNIAIPISYHHRKFVEEPWLHPEA